MAWKKIGTEKLFKADKNGKLIVKLISKIRKQNLTIRQLKEDVRTFKGAYTLAERMINDYKGDARSKGVNE
jgi:hypothetical protein